MLTSHACNHSDIAMNTPGPSKSNRALWLTCTGAAIVWLAVIVSYAYLMFVALGNNVSIVQLGDCGTVQILVDGAPLHISNDYAAVSPGNHLVRIVSARWECQQEFYFKESDNYLIIDCVQHYVRVQ